MKQTEFLTELKGEINSNTIIVGDFNIPLSIKGRTSRQKINKETEDLNNIIDQLDLTDRHRILHLTEAEYTFFSSAQVTSSTIDHMLGHKTSLNKFKKIQITPSIFSDMKLN